MTVIVGDRQSLKHALKALHTNRKRRLKRPPRGSIAHAVELAYRKKLLDIVKLLQFGVRAYVLPAIGHIVASSPIAFRQSARQDATTDTIASAIDRVRLLISQQVDVEMIVQDIASRVSESDLKTIRMQMESVLGIRPEVNEPWLNDAMAGFAKTNAKLVGNASQQFLDKLELRINDGARQGLRAEDIAQQVQDDFVDIDGTDVQTAMNRAKLIARDQVASFRGDLTKVRQSELGITQFVWRTSQDERVRKSHAEREGETFDWGGDFVAQLEEKGLTVDKIDGPPGRPILCRCTAEPVLDDLLDEG